MLNIIWHKDLLAMTTQEVTEDFYKFVMNLEIVDSFILFE